MHASAWLRDQPTGFAGETVAAAADAVTRFGSGAAAEPLAAGDKRLSPRLRSA